MLKVSYVGKLFNKTYKVELHNHKIWEVVYYTSGFGKVKIEDEEVDFEPSDIFVIPPNIQHSDYSDNGFQNIHFTFFDFDLHGAKYYKTRDNQIKSVYQILNQMYDIYQLKPNNWENIVNTIYDLFEHYLVSLSNTTSKNVSVEKVVNEIISNLNNPEYKVDDTISKLHFNKNYFRNLFQKETGFTPLELLTEKRLTHAKHLLQTRKLTKYSIKQIAFMCGYEDPYYFSRTFKKATGVSPNAW